MLKPDTIYCVYNFREFDDVVLEYLLGILQQLCNEQSCDEDFDVEDIHEMLTAYIPAIAEVAE